MKIRDRIKELRRVPAKELQPHPKNWRSHPEAQKNALRGMLAEVGISGVCVAFESERYGGLTLIDGHLRAEEDADWPTVILDVNDDEADKLLATFDTLSAQAEVDPEQLAALLEDVTLTNSAAAEMLDEWAAWHGIGGDDKADELEPRAEILAGATLKDLPPTDEEMAVLQGRRIIVEFSGGKDSSAAAVWGKHYLPDAPMELMFCDMGADFIGFPLFLREFAEWIGATLTIRRSEQHMIDVFLDKGEWPHFRHPYCHEVLHGTLDAYLLSLPADEIVILRGGRAQEKAAASKVRPDRWLVLDRKPDYRYFQPLYFADKDSGERILTEATAPIWEGYSRGLCRTACRICPGQRAKAYAAMRREFPDVWDELLALEEKLGPGCWQGRDGDQIRTFEEMADKAERTGKGTEEDDAATGECSAMTEQP